MPVSSTSEPCRRILVVDDNADAALSLALLLRIKGHTVHTAHDGQQAVQMAEAHAPEIALLDIGLPKLNGYEVAKKIRGEPWGQGMTLIALTGWAREQDRQQALDAGFNDHLVKPVEFEALAQLLAGFNPPA